MPQSALNYPDISPPNGEKESSNVEPKQRGINVHSSPTSQSKFPLIIKGSLIRRIRNFSENRMSHTNRQPLSTRKGLIAEPELDSRKVNNVRVPTHVR